MLPKNKRFIKSKNKLIEYFLEIKKARNKKLRLEDRGFIKHQRIDRQIENEDR